MPGAEGKMKQFASWFTHGVAGGAALRKSIYEAKTGVAILDAVERFFERAVYGERKVQPPAQANADWIESVALVLEN